MYRIDGRHGRYGRQIAVITVYVHGGLDGNRRGCGQGMGGMRLNEHSRRINCAPVPQRVICGCLVGGVALRVNVDGERVWNDFKNS